MKALIVFVGTHRRLAESLSTLARNMSGERTIDMAQLTVSTPAVTYRGIGSLKHAHGLHPEVVVLTASLFEERYDIIEYFRATGALITSEY